MTQQITNEIIDLIRSGDVDDDLHEIKMVVYARLALKGGQKRVEDEDVFRYGDTVQIIGKLRPNYLWGHKFKVQKVNAKTVVIDVPNEPQYRRFAGETGVRIPKTAVKVVA